MLHERALAGAHSNSGCLQASSPSSRGKANTDLTPATERARVGGERASMPAIVFFSSTFLPGASARVAPEFCGTQVQSDRIYVLIWRRRRRSERSDK